MLYSLKAWGSRISNMTFPCVNPIQLGPSPFNSSPHCKKKALYVIISGEIPENLVHKSCMYMLIFDVHANFLFPQSFPLPWAYLGKNVTLCDTSNTKNDQKRTHMSQKWQKTHCGKFRKHLCWTVGSIANH